MNKILDVVYGREIWTCTKREYAGFVRSMQRNNTFCPPIERVIFNVGSKAYPVTETDEKTGKVKRVKDENGKVKYGDPVKVLATVIYFKDGTKVTVTNSVHDSLTFDKNGNVSSASKEAGIVYAIVKRMFGVSDCNGTIEGNGFGRKLRDITESAYDTQVEEAKRKAAKAESVKLHEEKKANAKPKRPSFAETVVDLREAVNGMNEMINTIKADLNELRAAKA